MKLPSLFPAGLFAGGILLSICVPRFAAFAPRSILCAAVLFLLFGFFALRRRSIVVAVLLAAGAWISLGLAASVLERASVAPNLAGSLIESGKLDAGTPLRWRGRLRADPLQVPWGTRYEIDLAEVESAAGVTPITGG